MGGGLVQHEVQWQVQGQVWWRGGGPGLVQTLVASPGPGLVEGGGLVPGQRGRGV